MAILVEILWIAGVALASIFALDKALSSVLHWGRHLLPDDLVGPEGWFVDTKGHTGVFDRRR